MVAFRERGPRGTCACWSVPDSGGSGRGRENSPGCRPRMPIADIHSWVKNFVSLSYRAIQVKFSWLSLFWLLTFLSRDFYEKNTQGYVGCKLFCGAKFLVTSLRPRKHRVHLAAFWLLNHLRTSWCEPHTEETIVEVVELSIRDWEVGSWLRRSTSHSIDTPHLEWNFHLWLWRRKKTQIFSSC